MNIITPTQKKRMTFDLALKEINEKKKWLSTADCRDLTKKHGIHETTLRRQLSGKVKRLNFELIQDALDMINKHEAAIMSRLSTGS